MIKCKCSDCKIEFEYDYKISICDFCKKTLNKNDKFITMDCNLDKCEDCQKKK